MIRSFTFIRLKFVLFAVALASLSTVSVSAMIQGKSPRIIPRTQDPISKQLSTDDEHVLVEEFAIVDSIRLGSEELIRLRVDSAANIVLFRATAVAGEVTADGTWIRTRVRGVVEQTIKGQRGNGQSFEFYVHGGEARIGKVRVQAGDYPVFQPGRSYLVFVGAPQEPETVGTLEWVHERDADGRLKTMEPHRVRGSGTATGRGNRRSPFQNRTVDDIVGMLRKYQ